jgi:zinc transport system substrate-binding protein
MVFMPRAWRVAAVVAVAALLVVGCAEAGSPGREGAGGGTPLRVMTSFYPLQFAAERVAGDGADVQNLTSPGAEPHDLELTPRDVADLADADLVVYLSGFQPAVDTAVDEQAEERAYDVARSARLAPPGDPHFWLDPLRLADVADALAVRLARLAPADGAVFTRNAAALRADLVRLDGEFSTGLAHCASEHLVTSHSAFGYLAQRYGLMQRGITGLQPEEEPSPGDLAEITDFVAANGVSTVYSETLVSPAVAQTLAREAGVRTAVLDPLEGLDDTSAGHDYLEVMRANLATLRDGQSCR